LRHFLLARPQRQNFQPQQAVLAPVMLEQVRQYYVGLITVGYQRSFFRAIPRYFTVL
jgi:hypothetical protein